MQNAISVDDFTKKMNRDGWIVFPSVIDQLLIDRLNTDLDNAYKVCRSIQVKNGLVENTDGSVHHLVGLGDAFLELLERKPLFEYIRSFFVGQNFILNSYGGVINTPNANTYANKVHRDIRTFSGDLPFMINMLVMLDDFTLENGATHLATGSHLSDPKPSDEEFYATSDRAVGKAGSILLFNSNLWHATGYNKTQKVRRCLTPTFTRPFIKQGCDYPRVLGYAYGEKLSDDMKQILGYNARVPASLDEWYQPPEKRMYKPGQG